MKKCSGYTTENICHFTCSPGYDLVGSGNRTCSASRIWTGEEVKCKSKREIYLILFGNNIKSHRRQSGIPHRIMVVIITIMAIIMLITMVIITMIMVMGDGDG